MSDYRAEHIQVLSAMEGVRRRPGMYVGDVTDGSGMHHALWEVIGNAVDEHLAGQATSIAISFDGARVTVEDDGRGIPVDVLEHVLTTLHAGTGWRSNHVHLTAGLHGVGLAAVNALAAELEVTVWREGYEYVQRFARGEALASVERTRPTRRRGMRISFVPDFAIFTELPWNVAAIAARCRTLAGALSGLAIAVNDETWRYDTLVSYVEERAGCEVIDPFVVHARADGIAIDLALAWTRGARGQVEALVNCNATAGAHVEALYAALHYVLSPRLPRMTPRAFRTRIARGLVGVVHLQLDDPRYDSPSKAWLTNPEVAPIVRRVVEPELARHLDAVPALVDALVLDFARRVRVRNHGRHREAQVRPAVRGQRAAQPRARHRDRRVHRRGRAVQAAV